MPRCWLQFPIEGQTGAPYTDLPAQQAVGGVQTPLVVRQKLICHKEGLDWAQAADSAE
jgi:hypothetical protein